MKRIIDCDHVEARKFFLRQESYANFDLPKYFDFQLLLESISNKLGSKSLKDIQRQEVDSEKKPVKQLSPNSFENVNYLLLNNKDGKFAWRPLQLIHPAIYVSLVHQITEEHNWKTIISRFLEFSSNSKIQCYSIPINSEESSSDKSLNVRSWYESIEQRSLTLSLDFEYLIQTDLSDCYSSIYTHSIVWALHTKSIARAQRTDKKMIGNLIDRHLQEMSLGQTNGIPQGSALMDFIAEIVLGYADLELSTLINEEGVSDYKIIRYRDDYRIFSNNPQDGERITKVLTEVMIDLGLKLNVNKTLVSSNVIRDSVKPHKRYWITAKNSAYSLQEGILIIHELSEKYPNSGSLNKAMHKYLLKLEKIKNNIKNAEVLISIVVDITYKNPKVYPTASAILSKLLSFVKDGLAQERILNSITHKFEKIPNTGHIEIWLQRVTIKMDRKKQYKEPLCKKVNDRSIKLWNSDWLNDEISSLIESVSIIDDTIIDSMDQVIKSIEVQMFETNSSYESTI